MMSDNEKNWIKYTFYMLDMCIAFNASTDMISEMCNNVLETLKIANLSPAILDEFLEKRGYSFKVIKNTDAEIGRAK